MIPNEIRPPEDDGENDTGMPDSEGASWHVPAFGGAIVGIVAGLFGVGWAAGKWPAAMSDFVQVLVSFIAFHVAGAVAIIIVLFCHVPPGRRLAELTMTRSHGTIGVALRWTLGVLPLVIVANAVVHLLMRLLDVPATSDPVLDTLFQSRVHVVAAVAVGAVIIAPITEELIFRLVVHRSLAQYMGKSSAALATSLLFAISHMVPENVLALFVLALVLQYLQEKYANLWYPIAVHAMFNGVMVAIVIALRFSGIDLE